MYNQNKADNELGFSTNWNVRGHKSGRAVLEEIKSLGFMKVELNYRVKEEMLPEIYDMVEKGEIEICSVHNVFPAIADAAYDTDSLLLGYPDEDKRRKAVELAIGSAEHAERLGASVVVIHPGGVPMDKDYDSLLRVLYAKRIMDTDGFKQAFQRMKEGWVDKEAVHFERFFEKARETQCEKSYEEVFNEMLELRKKGSPKYTELIHRSLEEICNHLEKKSYKVKLAIENRAKCDQIPDFNEASVLFRQFKDMPVYFWYDIGHGILMESFGLFNNLEGVTALKEKMIGMHIHDAYGIFDHWSPYTFGDGFDRFLDLIRAVPVKVVELGPISSREAIIRSRKLLLERLNGIQD